MRLASRAAPSTGLIPEHRRRPAFQAKSSTVARPTDLSPHSRAARSRVAIREASRERATLVTRPETRVTGHRVVQYLIDSFLVGPIPALVSIPFDASDSTFLHVLGGIVAFVIFVVIGLMYWVIFAHRQNGQTLGMKLLGLCVISKGGGPANMAQLFIRWVCLIFDAIPYTWPFTGLVGFIVILCSRDRQRIGDHLARTLVIATGSTSRGPQYMGARQSPPQQGQPGVHPGEPGTGPGQST